jgi:two-component system sensor kinase
MLLLTSQGDSIDTAPIAAAGFLRVLEKPVRERDLYRSIAMAVGLPSDPADDPALPAPAFQPLGATVLVADDNDVNRVYAESLLLDFGCECVLAANGREALEALAHGRVDVVLMDVSMPEMDGLEAVAAIREREQRSAGAREVRHVPVIAVTAYAMVGDRERFLDAGMDDYLGKPFAAQNLYDVIQRWMPRHKRRLPRDGGGPAPGAA